MRKLDKDHPGREQLTAFALGLPEPGVGEEIGAHLADCPDCRQTVKEIPNDTFISLVSECETMNTSAVGPASPPPSGSEAPTIGPTYPETPASQATEGVEPSAAGQSQTTTQLDPSLANHPRYQIVASLGSGGMGAVYKAEHRLMQRTVALKVINPELVANKSAVERFRREVQAAARLHHPNIVTAHDAEQAGDLHFLVMEYVEGKDLAKVIEEKGPLTAAEACNYVRQAAQGLQHARDRGMAHRDIKPQNLMLTPEGQVKILDFGLASLGADDTGSTALTQRGAIMGTPDYIAPEQARDASSADIRADIYSLGCTLYCLLTGTVPFPGGTALDKIMAQVEREPAPLTDFRKDLPAQLVQILHKMMRKDRSERYQTPAEVADALAPFAVVGTAAPLPATRRRRLSPLARVAATAALLAALAAASVFYLQTRHGTVRIEINDPEIKVSFAGDIYTIERKHETIKVRPGEHTLLVERGDLKFETPKFTLGKGENPALRVEFTKDGALRVTHRDREFGTAPQGEQVTELAGRPLPETVKDAQLLLTFAKDSFYEKGGKTYVRDLSGRGNDGLCEKVAFTPQGRAGGGLANEGEGYLHLGRSLIANQPDFTVAAWVRLDEISDKRWSPLYTSTGQKLDVQQSIFKVHCHQDWAIHTAAWNLDAPGFWKSHASPPGLVKPREWFFIAIRIDRGGAATGRYALTVNGHLIDAGLQMVKSPNPEQAVDLVFYRCKGALGDLAVWHRALSDAEVRRLYEYGRAGKPLPAPPDAPGLIQTFAGHAKPREGQLSFAAVAFSPDGKLLASGGADGDIILRELPGGKVVRRIEAHTGPVQMRGLRFSPDGKRLLSGGGDHFLKVWDVATGGEVRRAGTDWWGIGVFLDDKRVLARKGSVDLDIWDVETGKALTKFPAVQDPKYVNEISVARDGRLAAVNNQGDKAGKVRLWDLTKAPKLVHTFDTSAMAVVLSPDGRRLLTASRDKKPAVTQLWSVETRDVIWKADDEDGAYFNADVEFTPDGALILAAGWGGRFGLRVRDALTGKVVATYDQGAVLEVRDIAASPDGRFAATAAADGSVRLYRLPTVPTGLIQTFAGHGKGKEGQQNFAAVAISPDGRLFASGGPDGVILLRDWPGGKVVRRIEAHAGSVLGHGLRFAAGGKVLLSGGADHFLKAWDVDTGKEKWRAGTGWWGLGAALDDKRVLARVGDDVSLRTVDTGAELSTFPPVDEPKYVAQLAVSRGGRLVAVNNAPFDRPGKVRLWDLTQVPRLVRTLDTDENIIALSSDGRHLLTVSRDKAPVTRLRAVDTGDVVWQVTDADGGGFNVTVAFTPDSALVLTAGWAGRAGLRVRDARTGKVVATYDQEANVGVMDIAVAPDGRLAATAAHDGTVRVYRLPDAGIQQPAGPFAILARDARAERSFAGLVDAVAAARSGDTIEIRGDGPYLLDPLDLMNKDLIIRSGAGHRPVLKQKPETIAHDKNLFQTKGALVLEGLDIQRTESTHEGWLGYAVCAEAPLYVANCRFFSSNKAASQLLLQSNAPCEVRNSLFVTGYNTSLGSLGSRMQRSLVYENNLSISAKGGWLCQLDSDQGEGDFSIRIARSTLVHGFNMERTAELPQKNEKEKAPPRLRMEAKENVVDPRVHPTPILLTFFQFQGSQGPDVKELTADEAEAFLSQRVAWSEQKNVYAQGMQALRLVRKNYQPLRTTKDRPGLAGWNEFWKLAGTGSTEGPIRYQGGDLVAKLNAAPEKLTPDDFRLAEGSAGKGVGPGGKDLGANVDLVGPGPAYERWKKTLEYQDWLKRSGQVAAANPPAAEPVRRFEGHTELIGGVALSADGARALSGSWDGTVRLWDTANGKELHRFDVAKRCEAVAMTPAADLAVSGHRDGTLVLWDLKAGKEVRRFVGHADGVRGVALSSDGRRVLSGSYDRTARVWDVKTGTELTCFKKHRTGLWSVALSPDGQHALTGDCFGKDEVTLRLWEVATGKELAVHKEPSNAVTGLEFLADGQALATGGWGNLGPRVFDLKAGKEVNRFTPQDGHDGAVHCLTVTTDSRLAVTGDVPVVGDKGAAGTVRVWDVASGKELHRFRGHQSSVFGVAVSADGRHVLSGGGSLMAPQAGDNVLRLWRLPEAVWPRGAPKVSKE